MLLSRHRYEPWIHGRDQGKEVSLGGQVAFKAKDHMRSHRE